MSAPAAVLLARLATMLHTVDLHLKAGNTQQATVELGLARDEVTKLQGMVS